MKLDGVLLRPARADDALSIASVHYEAVQALAGGVYANDVLHHWAPPVELARAERLFRETLDGATTLVAEKAGAVVGFGMVVPRMGELHGCYVAPVAAGQGIGRALVTALETIARQHQCRVLDVRASLNAVPFYEALGFFETRRATYSFADGTQMPVVMLTKGL